LTAILKGLLQIPELINYLPSLFVLMFNFAPVQTFYQAKGGVAPSVSPD